MTAFDRGDRITACFVNYASDLPAVPVSNVRFTLRTPRRVETLTLVPGALAVPFEGPGDDRITATLTRLDEFAIVVATY
jgi:hypothetical protein